MESLISISKNLVSSVTLEHKRYLFDRINWNNRLIAIIGARGVGKTTLMLQHIARQNDTNAAIYISAEQLYFSSNTLFDFAEDFIKSGGKTLCIDEIHQYPNWSKEIKIIYDSFPQLKVIFSGSSVLDIQRGSADLSRRVIVYHLLGLSYREYLNFVQGTSIPVIGFEELLQNKEPKVKTPLKHFQDYLKTGYYPFFQEPDYAMRLQGIINKIVDIDLVKYIGLKPHTGNKLKRLLMIVAEQVPFKPNLAKIAEITEIAPRLLPEYFEYMERAGLIRMLNKHGKSLRVLAKADKLYLDNTNLNHALSANPDVGNIRETFFLSQVVGIGKPELPIDKGDFYIDGVTFEVGGKNKSKKQIADTGNAYLVKDDIEAGIGNTIPLWAFGFLY